MHWYNYLAFCAITFTYSALKKSVPLGLQFSPIASGHEVKINYVRFTFVLMASIFGIITWINGFLELRQTNFTSSFASLSLSVASTYVCTVILLLY